MNLEKYRKYFNDTSFWNKIKKIAKKAGGSIVYAALILYYALTESNMPKESKMVILGALGYFILPLDFIPDIIPIAGFTDDLSALVVALIAVTKSITPEIKEKARDKLHTWFSETEVAEAVSTVNDKINEGKK
jgi:uncharacterized membrane protein YkvA (DUF1232 family)